MSKNPKDNTTPYVELISYTTNPIGVLYTVERAAKSVSNNPYDVDAELVQKIYDVSKSSNKVLYTQCKEKVERDPLFKEAGYTTLEEYIAGIRKWVETIIKMQIPIAEFVTFVFRINNVTIAFREQLVRHRTSTYWVQGGRIMDYSNIHENQRYNIPESVKRVGLEAEWDKMFKSQETLFKQLIAHDVTYEDAREIIGAAVTHRLSMSINLRNLGDMLKTRCCWIIQQHWGTIVQQIVSLLVEKVDPIFNLLGNPPCISNNCFNTCKFTGIVVDRFHGDDPMTMCPLFYYKCQDVLSSDQYKSIKFNPELQYSEEDLKKCDSIPTIAMMKSSGKWDDNRYKTYRELWGLNKEQIESSDKKLK